MDENARRVGEARATVLAGAILSEFSHKPIAPARDRRITSWCPLATFSANANPTHRPAMTRATLLRQRLLTLFLVGLLAWFTPLILRIESLGRWLGVPLLLIYLYLAWAIIVALAAWIVGRERE